MSALHTHIQAIRAESIALERHLDVQVQEYQRQLASLKRSSEAVKGLKDRRVAERVKEMEQEQARLGQRTERVLLAMQKEFRPKVGDVEARWFRELKELEGTVKGKGREVGMEQRARVVSISFS